ncbi:MAG: carboxypeptidase M32 [Nanoarchaeota archaeon]
MATNYEKLTEAVQEITLLSSIGSTLGWDMKVNMPPKGVMIRSQQLSYLGAFAHKKATSKEMGDLLAALNSEADKGMLTEDQALNVRKIIDDYEKATKFPTEFVAEMSTASSLGGQAWAEARATNDFPKFQPHLEKIVELTRKSADYFGFVGHQYNALIHQYEPGMTVEKLDVVFSNLRPFLTSLADRIIAEGKEYRAVEGKFSLEKQRELVKKVSGLLGFDFTAGRLDISPHPFTISFSPNDVRITTRYKEDNLLYALGSTIHETGHGLYEQGLLAEHFGMPLGEACSLGLHESQSRLWENHVGRSAEFWGFMLPVLAQTFPEFNGVELKDWMRQTNKVERSLIRVEADEVTYSLHVILRYEIEKGLLEGKIQVKDLPEVWNSKMQEYVGVVPDTNTNGVLQDMHWSMGALGYFPTYTLGSIYAAQLFAQASKELPLQEQIAGGKFSELREWLREKVHRHGKRYSADELVEKVTGSPLNANPLMEYLEAKYTAL